jgi:hypothetical protein
MGRTSGLGLGGGGRGGCRRVADLKQVVGTSCKVKQRAGGGGAESWGGGDRMAHGGSVQMAGREGGHLDPPAAALKVEHRRQEKRGEMGKGGRRGRGERRIGWEDWERLRGRVPPHQASHSKAIQSKAHPQPALQLPLQQARPAPMVRRWSGLLPRLAPPHAGGPEAGRDAVPAPARHRRPRAAACGAAVAVMSGG